MTREHTGLDRKILVGVLSFTGFFFVILAENGLAQLPVFFGSAPKLSLILLFILAIYNPAAVSLWMLVAIGLIHDLIASNPPGYTSALFLLTHLWAYLRGSALILDDGSGIWYEFMLAMLMAFVFTLVALTIEARGLPAFQPLLFQYGLTVMLFPLANGIRGIISGIIGILEGGT